MKINMSLLDKKTKEQIKTYKKRCKELYNGVFIKMELPVVFVSWTEGDRCHADYQELMINDHDTTSNIKRLMAKAKKEIDQEIEKILEFSDKVADKLGVDRKTFFNSVFTV